MRLLRFDLDIPFWCSFAEYGTLNIQQTYPFPPPPTLFGMILNAMGKPAIHTVDENVKEGLEEEYLDSYSKLRFSIVIRDAGEKIDDYLNIMKGSRNIEKEESLLKDEITKKLNKFDRLLIDKKEINRIANSLKREKNVDKDDLDKIQDELADNGATSEEIGNLLAFITNYWQSISEKKEYEIRKPWLRTQVHRQRLIQPRYSIYILSSEESGEFSINNLSHCLRNPKRPLYLGESDDIVDLTINGEGIVGVEDENYISSKLSSVLPGPRVYENCQIVKIPIKLRYDKNSDQKLICSIPRGDLREDMSCIRVCEENVVLL